MNTYGLFSINNTTFNQDPTSNVTYPKETRDTYFTLMKINNLFFNIAGYIPILQQLTSLARIALWSIILLKINEIGKPELKEGETALIAGKFYWEARNTAINQIFRGAMEFIPIAGSISNLILDIVYTFKNICVVAEGMAKESMCQECLEGMHQHGPKPHDDPQFKCLFSLLNLV